MMLVLDFGDRQGCCALVATVCALLPFHPFVLRLFRGSGTPCALPVIARFISSRDQLVFRFLGIVSPGIQPALDFLFVCKYYAIVPCFLPCPACVGYVC